MQCGVRKFRPASGGARKVLMSAVTQRARVTAPASWANRSSLISTPRASASGQYAAIVRVALPVPQARPMASGDVMGCGPLASGSTAGGKRPAVNFRK